MALRLVRDNTRKGATTFVSAFREMRDGMEWDQKQMAEALGISPQYVCDLEAGRRMPSLQFIQRLCGWIGAGPKGRLFWHTLGARAHGWEVPLAE